MTNVPAQWDQQRTIDGISAPVSKVLGEVVGRDISEARLEDRLRVKSLHGFVVPTKGVHSRPRRQATHRVTEGKGNAGFTGILGSGF